MSHTRGTFTARDALWAFLLPIIILSGLALETDRVLGLVSGAVAMQGPTEEVLNSKEFRATMTGDSPQLTGGTSRSKASNAGE